MKTPSLARRASRLFLSLKLAFSPLAVPLLQAHAEEGARPLAERVARAREELSGRFSGALVGLPPEGDSLDGAWAEYNELHQAYADLGSRLVSSPPAELSRAVRSLAPRFAVASGETEVVVGRYLALQTRLQENGVVWRGGRFLKADGTPFTPGQWLTFLGKGARLSPAAERDFLERNKRLADIHQLAQGKRFDEAAAAFDTLLKDFGGRKDLLEAGFGTLPLETTLSLIHETQRLLPKEHQARVAERLGAMDTQLQAIAARKIAVPAPGEKSPAADPGTAMEARLKLSFYAALSELPMTSAWAKERFFAVNAAETFRDDPNIAEKAVRTVGPDGKPRMGYFVRYKDGSSRTESVDGVSEAVSADGRTSIVEDRAKGSFKKTVGGREVFSYAPDPATGKITGRFLGTFFEAAKGELMIATPDGQKLLIAKSVDQEGKPVVDRWYAAQESGFYLPGGLGSIRKTWGPGNIHTDILLDPALLKASVGKAPDLSAIPENFLEKSVREAFEKFLGDLPQFGALFENSLKQETTKSPSGGKEITQSNWVEAFYIRDRQLTLVLGRGVSVSGEAKPRPNSTENRIVAVVDQEGGGQALKAFLFMGTSTFQWKFNPAYDKMEDFRADPKAQAEKGEIAFVLSRKYARTGNRWEITENHPIQMKQWGKWDTVKAYGSGALAGVGDAVGVVFSPFQTALYGIEGTVWLAGGAVVSAADRENGAAGFAKVQGVYTLRQAKFNEWLGQGTKGQDQILETYGSAREVLNEVTRKDLDNFLDGEIEKNRRQRYGELWRFHRDDPISYQDRAVMAAQTFGLSNMPGQFFQAGAESWQKGEKASAVLNYAAGGFVIAGEAYVEGLGFGLAAAPFKVAAVSARTGVAAEQVTAAMVKAGTKGVQLSAAEARAVSAMKMINRAEMGVFLTPAGVGMAGNLAGWVEAWRKGDSKAMVENFNGFYANAAGFGALGIGLIQARVSSFAAARKAAAEVPPVKTKAPESVKPLEPVKPPEPIKPPEPVKAKAPEPAPGPSPVDWIKDAAGKTTPAAVKADPLLLRSVLKEGMSTMAQGKSQALVQGKAAYQRGDAATIAKLQGRLNGELLQAAEAFAKSKGLKGEDFVSNGTTLDSLLGMFYSGGVEASSSYAGMKGESAHFWGVQGFKGGASYGATRALSRGKPGVLILMRNPSNPIKVVQGELLNRRPELGKDFAAVVITDGTNTVVLQKPQLEALAQAGLNWKEFVKEQAYKQGKMGPFNEWEAWGEKLLPKQR